MKRGKLLALILAGVMALGLLSACGGADTDAEQERKTAQETEIGGEALDPAIVATTAGQVRGTEAENGSFTRFIPKRKWTRTQANGIRDYSSSVATTERSSRSATRAAVLCTSEPCTTAFPMRWNCQKRDVTPSR